MAKNPHLREITDFELLLEYLEEHLGWPLDGYSFEDLTFTYEPEELGLKEADAVKVKSIRQLRPLVHGQPWGIFFVEFEKKKLPVVLLRRILSHLVLKKRASANNADRARWDARDLLFVSQFGGESDRELAFAHFKQAQGDLPTLNVLGWDGGDTPLKLQYVREQLEQHLHWPKDEKNVEAWRKEWSAPFKHGVRHTIRTADALAEAMAELAKRIRDAASALMKVESEKGPLRRMHAAFKTALIHDLTEEGFADTYAQTITYGLLTAAISRTDMQGGKHGTALVADNVADMVPITNPFLKEMLQSFLKVGGRKGGIDFDELGIQDVVQLFRSEETDLPAVIRDFDNKTRGEDPVIHFYEHFLAKYNKELKVQRGVFYTPKPVVGFIVRSVDERLRTEFGIEDGLASTITWREIAARNVDLKIPEGTEPDSPFVMVLDPATGTATFLVEVIDLVHKRLKANWEKGGLKAMPKLPASSFPTPIETFQDYWNHYVALSLLRRLHGYELMMAPYAIAHMKIGLKLAETKYRFGTEERARVYLTNALEPTSESTQLTIADWAPALAKEGEAVNAVKKHQRFTVIIGNPPYSIRSGNLTREARQLIEPFKYVDGAKLVEKGALQLEKNLNDDYVKFFGLIQKLLATQTAAVVGLITNHAFLDNPTFRGFRWNVLATYSEVHVVDLHGNSKKKENVPEGRLNENVFDIQQGVSVSLMLRKPSSATLAQVRVTDQWGTREEKYRALDAGGIDYHLVDCGPPWFKMSIQDPILSAEFSSFTSLADLMPLNSTGIKTHRDAFVIDFDKAPLHDRIEKFRVTAADDSIAEEYELEDTYGWKLSDARRRIRARKDWQSSFQQCLYRPFDVREIYYHSDLVELPRAECMSHLEGGKNISLLATRQITSPPFNHVLVTRLVSEMKTCSHDRGTNCFPLYLRSSASGLRFDDGKRVNVAPFFLNALKKLVAEQQTSPQQHDEELAGLVFWYLYGVLYSPEYRGRYAEFMKTEFPRIPLPASGELFMEIAKLGSSLVALHLLESHKLDKPITKFIGGGVPEVEKVSWRDNAVWIDKAQCTGFKGVPEAVWNYHIGGYQVCEKWLKDRGPKKGKPGRTLSAEDIAHYQKIVVAISETIRIQQEIDEVIEAHGGWPGAFASGPALEENTPAAMLATTTAKKPKAAPATDAAAGQEAESPGYIPDPGEIPFA